MSSSVAVTGEFCKFSVILLLIIIFLSYFYFLFLFYFKKFSFFFLKISASSFFLLKLKIRAAWYVISRKSSVKEAFWCLIRDVYEQQRQNILWEKYMRENMAVMLWASHWLEVLWDRDIIGQPYKVIILTFQGVLNVRKTQLFQDNHLKC